MNGSRFSFQQTSVGQESVTKPKRRVRGRLDRRGRMREGMCLHVCSQCGCQRASMSVPRLVREALLASNKEQCICMICVCLVYSRASDARRVSDPAASVLPSMVAFVASPLQHLPNVSLLASLFRLVEERSATTVTCAKSQDCCQDKQDKTCSFYMNSIFFPQSLRVCISSYLLES